MKNKNLNGDLANELLEGGVIINSRITEDYGVVHVKTPSNNKQWKQKEFVIYDDLKEYVHYCSMNKSKKELHSQMYETVKIIRPNKN